MKAGLGGKYDDGHVERAAWPAAKASGPDVQHQRAAGIVKRAGGCAPRNGPRLSSTIRSMFGGRGADEARGRNEVVQLLQHRRVEAALEADRGRGLRAHLRAAERARGVSDRPRRRRRARARSVASDGGRKRPRRPRPRGPVARPADEQRVARDHEPRLVAARAVAHDEAAVLRCARACAARGARPGRPSARGRRRAGRTRTRASLPDASRPGRGARARGRPWPETWSAWVWVSSTRTMRAGAARASPRYGSIAVGGVDHSASPVFSSPIK